MGLGDGKFASSSVTTDDQSKLNLSGLLDTIASTGINENSDRYSNQNVHKSPTNGKKQFEDPLQSGKNVRSVVSDYQGTSITFNRIFNDNDILVDTELFDGQRSRLPTTTINPSTSYCLPPDRRQCKISTPNPSPSKVDTNNAVESNLLVSSKNT